MTESNLARKDASGRHSRASGRGRCPRAELRSAPGRSGHHACRHCDRRAGCIAGSGRVAAGRARGAPRPTKPGPGRALGMRYSPWQEPWWNAGRRARPTADGSAQADLIRGATAPAGAEVVVQRLPAFRFLISFVLTSSLPDLIRQSMRRSG
jgi:hypothetical protein